MCGKREIGGIHGGGIADPISPRIVRTLHEANGDARRSQVRNICRRTAHVRLNHRPNGSPCGACGKDDPVQRVEALPVLRVNANKSVDPLGNRKDLFKASSGNALPLREADRRELDADVRFKSCRSLRFEEPRRICSVRICRCASGGLTESIQRDREASSLRLQRNDDRLFNGVPRNEALDRTASPTGALHQCAEGCGATHAQQHGATNCEEWIHSTYARSRRRTIA